MAGKKSKRGARSTGDLSTITPAFLPSVAFMAVPWTRATVTASSLPLLTPGVSQDVLNSSLVGKPLPPENNDVFSDPESSLYDYEAMEDPGYASVEMLAVRGQRKSISDRLPAPDPGLETNSENINRLQDTGQSFAGVESQIVPHDSSALYTTPMKKGRKSKSSATPLSLQRTEHEVREAMRAVQQMSSDEDVQENTFPKLEAERQNVARSLHFPVEYETGPKVPLASSTPVTIMGLDVPQPAEISEVMEYVERDVIDAQEPLMTRNLTSGTIRQHTSSTSRPDLEEKIQTLEAEKEHLLSVTSQLETDVNSYREVVSTYDKGDSDSAATLLLQKKISDLQEENEYLKSTVHRLNVELSTSQAQQRPVSHEQGTQLAGLPSKGPVPSWLLNIRYLNPLLLMYDDRLKERDETIKKYQAQIEALQKRTQEIVKENEKLHSQLEDSSMQGPIDITDWEQLKENARLVLEENQNLLEQINIKDQKALDLQQVHMREISKLSKLLALQKEEKADSEKELEELRLKYKEIKHKHDNLVLENQDKITLEEHLNQISELKRLSMDKEEQHKREIDFLNSNLQALEIEKKTITGCTADITAENRRLVAEVKAMNRSIRKTQQKMMLFQRAVEQSENKEISIQEHLGSIIKVAEKNAFERDTYAKAVREKEMESKKALNRLLQGNVAVGKMEEKLKLYKMRAAAKISTVAERLKEQDEAFNNQKKEYEREITHMRLLLKEKDEILQSVLENKREIERELEIIWQAASSDNERIKDTMRKSIQKLRKHSRLSEALEKEDKSEPLYLSSDDEAKT
ncbi:hypothetical protein ACJMK2_009182 [Sinanodonta woodiana]|uniref:Centrosomal protein of 89 kDa n=1 Tax=Sinanodonta woodiana TaxID=1069815 RepID=A0ABD3VD69_SINWO